MLSIVARGSKLNSERLPFVSNSLRLTLSLGIGCCWVVDEEEVASCVFELSDAAEFGALAIVEDISFLLKEIFAVRCCSLIGTAGQIISCKAITRYNKLG